MIRPILLWPDPKLREKSVAVSPEELQLPETQRLIDDMISTMEHHRGYGLAAIQIGVPLRIFVAAHGDPVVFVNPRITERSPGRESMAEGCLSLPGITENVSRHVWVRYSCLSATGAKYDDLLVRGILAQCVQHELEHLDGKMYVDRLPPGTKDRLRAHVRKRTGRIHP